MTLSDETRFEIRKHALENSKEECCGLLVETKNDFDLKVLRCKNLAENKNSFFSLNPKDFLKGFKTFNMYLKSFGTKNYAVSQQQES